MFIRIEILGEVTLEKSLTKYLIGEKEKCTNKGNDKYEYADSFYTLPHNSGGVLWFYVGRP